MASVPLGLPHHASTLQWNRFGSDKTASPSWMTCPSECQIWTSLVEPKSGRFIYLFTMMYGAVWGWCHNSVSNPSTFFQGPDRFDVVFFFQKHWCEKETTWYYLDVISCWQCIVYTVTSHFADNRISCECVPVYLWTSIMYNDTYRPWVFFQWPL